MLRMPACHVHNWRQMAEFALGIEVRRLVASHLASMDHLDVLLLLHREKDQLLSLGEIGSRTQRPGELIVKAAADLEKGGLLREGKDDAGAQAFAYAPASPELSAAVESLVEMYNERPVTLVRAIYDRPPEPVMSFADAFRIREGGK